jgi:hypothetical protein
MLCALMSYACQEFKNLDTCSPKVSEEFCLVPNTPLSTQVFTFRVLAVLPGHLLHIGSLKKKHPLKLISVQVVSLYN